MIPPERSAAFVAAMQDVLDLYAKRYDPLFPVACFDERPCQLIAHVLLPPPLKPGQSYRFDDEYERRGSANLFGVFEPKTGRHWSQVTERRRKLDFAACLKHLVDKLYPQAMLIRVVLDNLNTHRTAVLYEAFEPREARRLARKLEFHLTSKRGSWLNAIEVEFAALGQQCLNRWIGSIEVLAEEVQAWSARRDRAGRGVEWRFTTEAARSKLGRLYPEVQSNQS